MTQKKVEIKEGLTEEELFKRTKKQLLMIDPVSFAEEYLTLDGKPFRLHGNGYRPFSDIYRYIGIKALEKTQKPIILLKSRQTGGTTMANVLELFFCCSGLFGNANNPPIRIFHTFPQLEMAAAYSKTKLNQMIKSSIQLEDPNNKGKPQSYIQSLLDKTSETNDSLHFKQFTGGNHIWVESTGLDGDRLIGRMLSLETELPTPTGFIKLKDLKENDQLFDEQGNICNVIKLHPIDYSPESYQVTFDDGTTIDACADHLWLTYTKSNRNKKTKPIVKSTKDILKTLKVGNKTNHSILCSKPLNYPQKELFLDPYLLGLWLGDRSETADPEILNNKIIPIDYMTSSFEQRLSLLQGLMDTDGHCSKKGFLEFVQVREGLARQVYELVLSLGIKATINKRESWRIIFKTSLPVFRLKRKLNRIKKTTNRSKCRFITKVESIQSVPMRCITVDSDSHLFLITKQCIVTHNTADVMFFDEVQRNNSQAIGNCLKILTTAKYGPPSKGVQVFFGTPRKKGSDYHKMWMGSSQQYYHLGCERCKKHFPLFTPGSDEWKSIWLHGFIVKCTHCGFEQNKLEAQERGKWIALKDINDPDCLMVGFHINALYMPMFSKEDILKEEPGTHPINTERVFMNEVLGEFFQGESSPITQEDIREKCADVGRRFSSMIEPPLPGTSSQQIVVLGIDYGAKSDLEQMANPEKSTAGQSYSTAVVLSASDPHNLKIEFATKFKRNDMESKKGIIDQLMRQYSVQLAIGDIGYSNDFSSLLHNTYGDKYIVSRAHNKVNGYIKYSADAFPKEIVFERDYYFSELFEKLKKGEIRFPFGDFEKVAWLIEHCCSMEIKPTISRSGDPSLHYVKGGTPNDGFCALLNAYIAFKFIITKAFTSHNPFLQEQTFKEKKQPLVLLSYIPRRF